MSVLQARSITCWPPVVTMMSSSSTGEPSASITCAMACLAMASPSVGPYWRAFAVESTATRDMIAARLSAGNVDVSGSPPASEMMSGRSVMAIRSRIAEDFMTFVRAAKRPA